jgi:hypothetical protein
MSGRSPPSRLSIKIKKLFSVVVHREQMRAKTTVFHHCIKQYELITPYLDRNVDIDFLRVYKFSWYATLILK